MEAQAIVTDINLLATLVAEKLFSKMVDERVFVLKEDAKVVQTERYLSGLDAIARHLHISKSYLSMKKKEGVFSDSAMWQDSRNGKVYADPELIKEEWKEYLKH